MPESTVLHGVTVVDTRDGSVQRDRDVVLADGRISVVGPATPHPADAATVIDAAGVIRGPRILRHARAPARPSDPSGSPALMLARDITGFRQLAALASDATATEVLRRAVDTFSDRKAEELAARFVEDGTWQMPQAHQRAGRRPRVPH